MKRIVKRISITAGVILVIVIVLHVVLFTFINTKGRDLIVGGLKKSLGLEATMGSLSLKFPFNLEIKDFECAALSFKRANVSLGFFNPFAGNIKLSKVYLDGLDLKVAKDKGGISLSLPSRGKPKAEEKIVLPEDSLGFDNLKVEVKAEIKPEKEEEKEEEKEVGGEEESKSGEKKFSLAIGNLYLKNSRIEVNYPIKKRPVNIIFSDLSLRVKGFTYPKLSRFYVKLDTVLVPPSQESQGINALGIKGWVDYNNKNMDVDINIGNFDYTAFGRFYPPFLRPNNLRLKEAILSFESNLKSKDNSLTIDNLLTIEGVEFIEEEDEVGSFQAKILKTALSFLKGDKEKPSLHFKLTTNMDSPKLDLSSLKKSLMEAAGIGPLMIIEGAVDKIKGKIEGLGGATVGSVVETLKGATETIESILDTDDAEEPQESKEDTSKDEKAPQE